MDETFEHFLEAAVAAGECAQAVGRVVRGDAAFPQDEDAVATTLMNMMALPPRRSAASIVNARSPNPITPDAFIIPSSCALFVCQPSCGSCICFLSGFL